MMPRNFPSHPHVTTPSCTAGPQGSTGPMAEVVDTRQGQELDQELARRVQPGDSAAFDLLARKDQRRIATLSGRYCAVWLQAPKRAHTTSPPRHRAHETTRLAPQLSTPLTGPNAMTWPRTPSSAPTSRSGISAVTPSSIPGCTASP